MGIEESRAETLGQGGAVAGYPLCQGCQSHVGLQGRGGPPAYAAFLSHAYPFVASTEATVQGGLEHDILRTYGVEQGSLAARVVDADEFLVEGDGEGRGGTQTCHLFPLVLADRLLYAMQVVAGQFAQACLSLSVRSEGPVGIHSQGDAAGGALLTDAAYEAQFVLKVYGTYLEFDAAEAGTQLLLQAFTHLLVTSHPHEAVDGAYGSAVGQGRGSGMESLWQRCSADFL